MSDFCAPYIPMDLPPRSGFLGTRVTNLSIPSGVITAVTLPVETQDIGGWFTAGASSGTVPAGKAGIIAITAQIVWATSSLGTAPMVRMAAGGVTYDYQGVGTGGVHAGGVTVPLIVGDTISISAFQNSGGAINVTAARLSAYLVTL